MRIVPAPADSGLAFVRTDRRNHTIPVRKEFLAASRLCTSLARDGAQVGTVEHVLAALTGVDVDNARIEVDGPEVPILDGSAEPFARRLLETGLVRQDRPRDFLTILRPVEVQEGDRRLAVFPSNEFRATYAIRFEHPAIGYQERALRVSPRVFLDEIAPARTFCLYRDVEEMRRQGLALGGDASNAVVVGDDGILTGELRYPDEFVRHKILDLLGDLTLLGHPLRGHVVAYKAGHSLHAALVERILRTPGAWKLSDAPHALPASLLRRFETAKHGFLHGLTAAV
jgi:UDP-3-O-[3-hydroxymyristoyl] N-acetylglucosamine deacetylase